MATINPFDFFLEPQAETFHFAYDPVLEHSLASLRRLPWTTPSPSTSAAPPEMLGGS